MKGFQKHFILLTTRVFILLHAGKNFIGFNDRVRFIIKPKAIGIIRGYNKLPEQFAAQKNENRTPE